MQISEHDSRSECYEWGARVFNRFDHYLSYGSSDQQTVRQLSTIFNGLLVPGTIAAFQAEGTKGFVLSLSARSAEPYVIDPRFPLFQNKLEKPKRSHEMLAELMGVPKLINQGAVPQASSFNQRMIETIAENWIEFNTNFHDVTSKTFDKYASRLGEEVLPSSRRAPEYILPPYTMIGSQSDGWWDVSRKLWLASVSVSTGKNFANTLRRVVAAKTPRDWNVLASDVPDKEIVAWVSDLEEFRSSSEDALREYGKALKAAKAREQKVFALYGGFFSVLLSRYGLTGSSHGIGFGEHRDSIELPSSGAAPARYYVPRLHRYVGVDIALSLWRQFRDLVTCDCVECNHESPAALDYHALMRHSVRARNKEISEWLNLPSADVVQRLNLDFEAFASAITELKAPEKVIRRAEEIHSHLPMWTRILGDLE